MTRIIHCPCCSVELTIPEEAGARRLRCPKCETRFYPPPRAGEAPGSSASSVLARPVESPRPTKKAKVPPSSGHYPASGSRDAGSRPSSSDLRDRLDIPLLDDDGPAPPRPGSCNVADVSALFKDDPPPRPKRPAVEARRESRRCPDCRSLVLGGMSLCESCGLDLDTGLRDVPDEILDAPPPPTGSSGVPVPVMMIGVLTLTAGLLLGLLSILRLEGLGRICLTLVCLFGAYASVEFLRGRTAQYLIVALLLGGAIDIATFIVMPVIVADATVVVHRPTQGEADPSASTDGDEEPRRADPIAPLAERIDMPKVVMGVALLILDALLLVAIGTPAVKGHFQRQRVHHDEGYVIP